VHFSAGNSHPLQTSSSTSRPQVWHGVHPQVWHMAISPGSHERNSP